MSRKQHGSYTSLCYLPLLSQHFRKEASKGSKLWLVNIWGKLMGMSVIQSRPSWSQCSVGFGEQQNECVLQPIHYFRGLLLLIVILKPKWHHFPSLPPPSIPFLPTLLLEKIITGQSHSERIEIANAKGMLISSGFGLDQLETYRIITHCRASLRPIVTHLSTDFIGFLQGTLLLKSSRATEGCPNTQTPLSNPFPGFSSTKIY